MTNFFGGLGWILMTNPPKNFIAEPFEYHEEIELKIDDLNHLGSGVGRFDGWVVFVPFTLPGELVRVKIWRNKKNYSDADLVEIIESSPDRVEPRCKLFKECGGCQYQHFDYEAQLDWISKRISELLSRLAGIEVDVNPCIGSPKTYSYRSKITPHFRKPPDNPKVPIGFQRASSRSIVDVDHCPIASEAINQMLTSERKKLRSGEKKYKRGGTLLLRDCDGGVLTDMRMIGEETIGDCKFRFVAGEFFQNNPYVLPSLIQYTLEQAEGEGILYLADVYCGVGVFGICGATRFKAARGIEVNERAIQLAHENAKINEVDNIDFCAGVAENIFDQLDFAPEKTSMIIDPPRKGCDEAFIQQACKFGAKKIVYVSCGPDTQARDARLLIDGGYAVESVQPFDLFPQTRHIENVITFVRS